MNSFCTICSDRYNELRTICAAKCGHVFHEDCLLKWLEQANTCPQCRLVVTRPELTKLYFEFQQMSNNSLEVALCKLEAEILEKELENQKEKEKSLNLLLRCNKSENCILDCQLKLWGSESREKNLRLELKELKRQTKQLEISEKKIKDLEKKLSSFKRIETAVLGSQKESEKMLSSYNEGSGTVKELVTSCSLLKREVKNLTDTKKELRKEIVMLRNEIQLKSSTVSSQKSEKIHLESLVKKLQVENQDLEKQISQLKDSIIPVNERTSPKAMKQKRTAPEEVLSKTPTVTEIIPGPSKRFKIRIASFEKALKVPRSGFQMDLCTNVPGPGIQVDMKGNIPDDRDSVITTGYNGLGGHSNFVRIPCVKNTKPCKKRNRSK